MESGHFLWRIAESKDLKGTETKGFPARNRVGKRGTQSLGKAEMLFPERSFASKLKLTNSHAGHSLEGKLIVNPAAPEEWMFHPHRDYPIFQRQVATSEVLIIGVVKN